MGIGFTPKIERKIFALKLVVDSWLVTFGKDRINIDYYGVLTEIIILEYLGSNYVELFWCNWWDVHDIVRGIKVDKFGVVSINSRRVLKTKDPFILTS